MPSVLLPILLIIPLLGAAAVAMLPRGKDEWVRPAALLTTLVAFLASLLAVGQFKFDHSADLQLSHTFGWVQSFGLSFDFGVDGISLWLVLLTTFLMPIVVLGAFSAVSERVREFFIWLLILESAMIGTFVATDIIFFYICFEFTLVPLYFLIGIWGSTQRLRAAKVFFLYTFTGSMLTFAGVLWVAWHNAQFDAAAIAQAIRAVQPNVAIAELQHQVAVLQQSMPHLGRWTFNIQQLAATSTSPIVGLSATEQAWVLGALLAGFAVKVPIFPVHTWLPLAHTEAPTAGSVILAGVLLKLGTYGLLRLAIPLCPVAAVEYAPVIGTLAVIGILYTGLICWVQKDIKKLIAYSSVSHLGFCVLGLFALGENVIGPSGAVIYMINHGLSTGALFLCVGMIYERFHTREMRQYGGMAKVMPVWAFFMVFFCMASVGLPGLNGFVGEFLTLLGAFTSKGTLGPGYAAAAGVGMIIGAIYILYMVGKVMFGPVKVPIVEHHDSPDSPPLAASRQSTPDTTHHHAHPPIPDLTPREILTLLPLAIACLVLGLQPNLVLDSVTKPVAALTAASEQHAFMEKLHRDPPNVPYVNIRGNGEQRDPNAPPQILPGADIRPLIEELLKGGGAAVPQDDDVWHGQAAARSGMPVSPATPRGAGRSHGHVAQSGDLPVPHDLTARAPSPEVTP